MGWRALPHSPAHPGGASVPGKQLSQLWRNWSQGYTSAQLWFSSSEQQPVPGREGESTAWSHPTAQMPSLVLAA